MKNFLRGFISIWYLLGWISHVYLGLFSPDTYSVFGTTAIFPAFTQLWQNFFMPRITIFALLLAAFEITVGILIIIRGKWVKYGLVLSLLFNMFLVQMGLGMPATSFWSDFIGNRMANLIFIALQIPLFWGEYKESLPQVIKRNFFKKS